MMALQNFDSCENSTVKTRLSALMHNLFLKLVKAVSPSTFHSTVYSSATRFLLYRHKAYFWFLEVFFFLTDTNTGSQQSYIFKIGNILEIMV